jgi:hypothetical protein
MSKAPENAAKLLSLLLSLVYEKRYEESALWALENLLQHYEAHFAQGLSQKLLQYVEDGFAELLLVVCKRWTVCQITELLAPLQQQ